MVVAALVGGTLADAQPQEPPPPAERLSHLLVVPDTPEGKAALAGSDVRVVARYGSFSLVEAAGRDEGRLRRAGADRRDDMRTVRTAAGDVDPATERLALAAKEGPELDEVLALVQFVGPVKDAWLDRVRATGAHLVTYQAENSYVVHANGDEVDALAALAGSYPPVRAVAALTVADKLESPEVHTGRYAVQTVSGAEGADARDEASGAGAAVGRSVAIAGLHTQYLTLSVAEAADLARDPAVVTVEPYAEPRLADERGAQIVAGNLAGFVPSGAGYLDWLVDDARIPNSSTFNFAIDVTDEGLDGGLTPPAHQDFGSRISYLNNYSSDAGPGPARDCGGHGTNVASIAAGNNTASGPLVEDGAGYNYGLGVAPFAQIGASKIFDCGGGTGAFTPGTVASSAYLEGARISNNSWGTGGQAGWGSYSTRAREYDALVRDARSADPGNQELVEIFAAGNDGEGNPGTGPNEGYGTILSEGTAKNVITVGAAEGVRPFGLDGCGVSDGGADSARDMVDFSSRGPTDDGRLKPDLVAPGSHMVGARPRHGGYHGNRTCEPFFGGSSAFYSMISGSSQAAPQVSGAAALVRHWYERAEGVNPSPALTKALLINTATDLAGGSTGKGATIAGGPNTDQGWGRVSVGSALDSTPREYRDQDAADRFGGPGATRSVTYAAQNPAKPVKVTLVWTDAPGPAGGNAWVNNLDLEVEARGNRYLGNVFAGGLSRTGGAADTRNNVESVYLPPGPTGHFTVSVESINVSGDGVPGVGDSTDQDYALVVSNAVEEEAPVLAQAGTAIDDAGPGGDGDGILESGESVGLTQQVRNSGNEDADGISAALTGSPGFDVSQPASSYLTLAQGATDANDPPFEAGLANAATCGAEIQPTLDITTTTPSVETHTIPLVLPTGEAGPSLDTNAAAAQLQLAIPDDSGAGVSSTLFVSQRGRIKDLDVRLPGTVAEPGIEHDFVGDVVIDLIGPDGTTVRLAEHPGGPDNPMKDFQDVTFDDEALRPIGDPAAPAQPSYNGSFRPQNDQLSRFDGKDRRGTWTLRVRDLFETDTGTLRAWGVTSQRALCDFDTDAPATQLLTNPAASSDDTSPSFGFDSPDDPGAVFECRLDAGEYEPCASIKTYGGLALGQHTFYVRAVDGSGNEDASPEVFTWAVVDSVAPVVTLTEPANGSSTTDTTPRLAGVAGTLPGDDATVTLRLWRGTLAVGLPVQTLTVPRGGGGGFAAVPSALTEGTYTARAEQGDSALPSENVGVSAPVTFTVQSKPPSAASSVAPSFVLAQTEERLSNARANRYTVLAACAAACRVNAKLSVSASAARRLGMRARATAIGGGAKRLVRAGAAAVRVGLTDAADKALRDQVSSTATLDVIVRNSAGVTLTLKRKVKLRRSAGLDRIAGRGMGLWAVCSRDCSMRGALRISAARARDLGVKPTPAAGSTVAIAAGRADSGASAAKLTLRVPAALKKALRGASRLTARLEASAGASGTSLRKASRRLTLR